jgi:hypothetical protein
LCAGYGMAKVTLWARIIKEPLTRSPGICRGIKTVGVNDSL